MHTIRLRGPWDFVPQEDPPGTTRCTRHFHKPTGLDSGERVWLVIEGLAGTAQVSVNDTALAQASGMSLIRFDLTTLLRPHNELIIDIACPPNSDLVRFPGEVRLEIESEIRNLKSEI